MTPPDEPLARFREWLEQKDGLGADAPVRAERRDGWGLCLTAERAVSTGEILLQIPRSIHLSASAAKTSRLASVAEEIFDAVAGDESGILALYLLHECAIGEQSDFAPYVAVLPTADDLDVPLLWSDEERMRLLGGSHLELAVASARADIIAQWEALHSRVIQPNPQLFPPGADIVSLEGYLWAHAIALSRALPFGEELSLIPMLDFANHEAGAPNTCSIVVKGGSGWEAAVDPSQLQVGGATAAAQLTAGVAAPAGTQLFIDYGEAGWRSSWEMLYTYGFVPGQELEEWLLAGGRPLFFSAVELEDPLRPQKQALLTALGAAEDAFLGTWVDLRPEESEVVKMAPLLRLAAVNERTMPELAASLAGWSAEPLPTWNKMQVPIGVEVELAIARRVIAQCEEALATLPTTESLAPIALGPRPPDPGSWESEPEPETTAQRRAKLAARVMLGERHAIEVCASVWKRAAAAATAASAAESAA